jgi:hypothetical protein
MTRQFFEKLPRSVGEDVLFSYITAFIKQRRGKDVMDVEDVLWALGELADPLERAASQKDVFGHLLHTNQVMSVTSTRPPGAEIIGQFVALRARVEKLRDQINAQVYEHYRKLPTRDELARTWSPLLRWARGLNPESIDIVTTNYDLVIESALDVVRDIKIETGKRAGLEVTIDLDLWGSDRVAAGLLTKLHGSVDWKFGSNADRVEPVIRWGHPEHDGNLHNRGIIYPGFKGKPKEEPFSRFHSYFGRTASVATHLLFIGFAFRDEYINELLEDSLSPSARVAVLDPASSLPTHSFLQGARHLQFPFGNPQTDVNDSRPDWLQQLVQWIE